MKHILILCLLAALVVAAGCGSTGQAIDNCREIHLTNGLCKGCSDINGCTDRCTELCESYELVLANVSGRFTNEQVYCDCICGECNNEPAAESSNSG